MAGGGASAASATSDAYPRRRQRAPAGAPGCGASCRSGDRRDPRRRLRRRLPDRARRRHPLRRARREALDPRDQMGPRARHGRHRADARTGARRRIRELPSPGRSFSGAEACYGFATAVHADPLAAARATAQEIAGRSPDAVRALKRLLNAASDDDAAAILLAELREQAALIGSPNQIEAIRAGIEKAGGRGSLIRSEGLAFIQRLGVRVSLGRGKTDMFSRGPVRGQENPDHRWWHRARQSGRGAPPRPRRRNRDLRAAQERLRRDGRRAMKAHGGTRPELWRRHPRRCGGGCDGRGDFPRRAADLRSSTTPREISSPAPKTSRRAASTRSPTSSCTARSMSRRRWASAGSRAPSRQRRLDQP